MEKFSSKNKGKKKPDIEEDFKSSPPQNPQSQKLVQEFIGLFFLLLGALIFLSLISYSPEDPTLNVSHSRDVVFQNQAGMVGAYLSALLIDFFGLGSYVWSLFFIALGGGFISKWLLVAWYRFLGFILFGISLISLASAWSIRVHTIIGGGFLGDYLYQLGLLYFSPIGSAFIWFFILLFSTQLIFGISWLTYFRWFFSKIGTALSTHKKKDKNKELPENSDDEVIISMPTSSDSGKDKSDENKSEKKLFSSLFGKKSKKQTEEKLSADDTRDENNIKNEDIIKTKLFNLENDDFDIIDDDDKDDIVNLESHQIAGTKKNKKKSDWSPFSLSKKDKAKAKVKEEKSFELPSPSLLALTPSTDIQVNKKLLDEKGQALIHALSEYNIDAKLYRITPGPVVTMFEIRLAAGIRVSKIVNLSDDLAMTLKAIRIRIQAPIPGSDTVGIEIPNEKRANVSFRELLEGNSFQDASSLLSIALGKDISGVPFTANLATMPHLLVAGATGAGKSVCLNTIILSFLYKAKPDELKLLLIDPKRVELSNYQDLPHLVHPVITEMSLAKNALLWAVDEMERRFKLLEDLKVKNLSSYNEKVEKLPPPPEIDVKETSEESSEIQDKKEDKIIHKTLPYLVVIIDELADLMMMHGKDVEQSIVRLGQKARAAGIHIILATQRPSVDVVTGLIKTNCPGRISFQVSQKIDSRTILDAGGAEALLGKGDMLFRSSGGSLERLHGAFVPDDDVEKVIDFWKKQAKPDYSVDFSEYGEDKALVFDGSSSRNDISQEPIYQEALSILTSMEKISISALQRRLRIGFNKAALIKEQLVKDGHIIE